MVAEVFQWLLSSICCTRNSHYRNSEYVCFYFLTAKLEVTSGFSDPPQRTWVKRLVSFSACFRVWVRLP